MVVGTVSQGLRWGVACVALALVSGACGRSIGADRDELGASRGSGGRTAMIPRPGEDTLHGYGGTRASGGAPSWGGVWVAPGPGGAHPTPPWPSPGGAAPFPADAAAPSDATPGSADAAPHADAHSDAPPSPDATPPADAPSVGDGPVDAGTLPAMDGSTSVDAAWDAPPDGAPVDIDAGGISLRVFSVPRTWMPLGITAGPDGNIWFVSQRSGMLTRITLDGAMTHFQTGGRNSLQGITSGPDGHLWYGALPLIGRSSTAGMLEELPIEQTGMVPSSLAFDAEGSLWFMGYFGTHFVGKRTPDGAFTRHYLSGDYTYTGGLTIGPDGQIWFIKHDGHVARITLSGDLTELAVPETSDRSYMHGITTGPDGNLWFTHYGHDASRIVRLTPDGVFTQFPAPSSTLSSVGYISPGPDGALWFTGRGHIGRITVDGVAEDFPIPVSGYLTGFATGADGTLWFTASDDDKVVRVTLRQ